MENVIMLDILNEIKMLLTNDEIALARKLTKLELENLKGITEKRCKNTKYYFYECYCKYCNNFNCRSNKDFN